MKNQIQTTAVVVAMCLLTLFAQAQSNVNLFLSQPDTIRACDVNRFSVSIVNPVTDTIIITPQLNFPNGTSASCSTNSNGVNYIYESVTGGSVTTLQTDSALQLVLDGTDTVTFTYRVEIDCHVIMIDSSAGLVKLQQDFTGSNTYIINPSSSNSVEQAVNYTKIVELNANSNFYCNYQQDTTWLFYYKNTLSHRTNIGFTFNVNTALPCTSLVFDPVMHFSNGLYGQPVIYNNTNPAAYTIMLNPYDTLVIRVKVKATSCVNCDTLTATFNYRCNQSLNGCSACEKSFVHRYKVNMNDMPKIDVQRVSPQQVIYDNSCINDTTQTTLWSYNIVNTGNCAIDSIQFDLTQLGDAAWDVRRLMLMSRKSLVIEKSALSHCNIDTVLEIKSQHLCADLVDTAVYSCYTIITDFFPGDTVHVSFTLLRCSEDTSVLMNAYKYYNAWMFKNLKTKSICGVEQPVPTASGFASGIMLAGQTSGGGYDVHLQNQFYPAVSDMSVSNSGIGDIATFNVRLNSILNNGKPYIYQLLGCNQPQQQCNTLNGWLRATVVCDTNLTIPVAYSDAFMITLSATGDTTFYKPYYYDITQDSLSCQAKKYHYYFNLADSGMRTVIDSGRFVYTLQACCNSDTDPTPYKAEFHLLADANNCFNINLPTGSNLHYAEPTFTATDGIAQWLPLSNAGNTISIHCPGCVIVGPIVDHYSIERNTFGLQDSDNDHRADSASATIDTGSAWFAQNKNNLSSTTLAYGDRCTDYLRAHIQPGDPANDGYSYAMMKHLGLRLNALQLSRMMPLALDTMMVVPDTLTFYIDDPTDSIGGCYECEPFGAGNDDFITLLKVEVTGTDIAQFFLNTNTSLNEYLYSFTSYFDSTAVSDTGNLHNTQWHKPTGSSRSFHGFEEGQSIRLKVSYHVCGNFNPAGDLTAENTYRQSHIQNIMWLSGKRQTHSQVPQMEQSLTLLQDTMHITVYDTLVPTYSLMDTSYVNNRLFFCETRGGFAYFAATTYRNKTIITNKNVFQCLKRMEINMSSGYCNNALLYDAYPFEYRSPLIAGQAILINVPQGYEIVKATSKHKVPIGNNFYQTMPVDITALLPDTTGNFSLNTTLFIATHCLTNDTSAQNITTGITAYMGDQFYEHTITLDMMPISCTDDTAHNNSSSTVVTFGNQAAPCQSFYGCQNISATMTNASNAIEDFTLGANMTVVGMGNSLATGISDTVCWNNLVLMNTKKDNADHVFLSIANAPAYLSQWHYKSNPSNNIIQANGDVIGLIPTLAQNVLLSGNVCAVMDSCPPLQDTANFYLYYGWNCKDYPDTPFTVDSVCFTDSVQLKFTRAAFELVTASWSQTNAFSLCDTLFAEAKFQNGKAGFVYPFRVSLPNYDPRLQIIAAMACSNTDTVGLTPTAAPEVWTVTTDSLLALFGNTGIHNSQYVTIRFLMVAPCGFGMEATDVLPALQLTALSICNDTVVATSRQYVTELPAFAWDSTSQCPDCWSITKTAGTDTVAVGDTLSYTITVCNNSANAQTATLADNTPANFVITNSTLPDTITLNSMQCDTFTVSGYFTSPGSCLYNVASVTSPANTTWMDSVCVSVNYACTDSSTFMIYDSTYSTTLNYRYDTLNVFVEGKLFVNDTLKFMRCNVYMNAGAHIIVQAGGYLDINSSMITGCLAMWRGITVEDFGEVKIWEGSTVADADTTVLANNKAKATLHNAFIKNFVMGVYVPPSANVYYNGTTLKVEQTTFDFNAYKQSYTGQNIHGIKPECGILLNDWIGTIGTYQFDTWLNKFLNLNSGIAANRSQLTVKNCYFNNIQPDNFTGKAYNGSAVFGKGDATASRGGYLNVQPVMNNNKTMVNCRFGVKTNYSSLELHYVKMDSMWVGAQINFCTDYQKTRIGGNEIKASRAGVMMSLNAGASLIDVSNNNITMQSSGLNIATGIGINETNKLGLGNYMLENNFLYLYDCKYGISMNNVYKPLLAHNYIEQNGNAVYGIRSNNCDSTQVRCNQVRTMNISNTNTKGIYYSLSKNGSISCNSTDTTATGLWFGGNCMGTQLKGNTLRNNLLGMYINNVGLTGVQPNNGNKFIDYRDTIGVYNANLGTQGLSLSRFLLKTGTQQGSIYYPVLAQQNNGWFIDNQTSNPYLCGATCYDILEGIDNETLYRIIVGDSILTDVFIPESQSMARQYLFEILSSDSALLVSDTLFQNFYAEMQEEAEGQLQAVERNFENYGKMDSTFIPLLQNIDSLIRQYNNYIEQFDEMRDSISNTGLDADSLREQWYLQIENLEITRVNILMQHNAVKTGQMYEGELTNNIINGDEQNEINSTLMNELFVQIEEMQYTNISAFYSQLLSIAEQCPYYGGEAVYRARAMLSLINDSMFYNDEANCLQYGIYKQGLLSDRNSNDVKISVKPNPANNYIKAKVNCKENEMYEVEIINAIGQKVLYTSLHCNKENNINITYLHQGIYTVIVKTNTKVQTFKLSIIR